MSLAFSIHTTSTVWPLMSMPRMFDAWWRASAGVGGELDAARLAPAAHLHLRLHDDRVAELVGRFHRLLHGVGGRARRHGDAVARRRAACPGTRTDPPAQPLCVGAVDRESWSIRPAVTNRGSVPERTTAPTGTPAAPCRTPGAMAPSRDDTRILVFATFLVVVAGVLVAVVLLLATGRASSPTKYEPFEAGAAP